MATQLSRWSSVPAQHGKTGQGHQRQMSETEPPAERRIAAGEIENKTDAERTDKTPGVSAHAVQAHGRAAQRRIRGLNGRGSKRGTLPEYRGEPDHQDRKSTR